MELILLGGRDKSNEPWIEEVEKRLEHLFPKSRYIHKYVFWNGENSMALTNETVMTEARKLAVIAQKIENEYAIFGKSMGSMVAVTAISRGFIVPRFCIFAGLPMRAPYSESSDTKYRFKEMFSGYQTPTLIIQNGSEEFMRPDELRETLKHFGVQNTTVATGKDNGHYYSPPSIEQHFQEYVNHLKVDAANKR